ncbi:hypothetical protein J1N35_029796 [Gossypium stocksii]|uniref:Aminotransferase-like plant mobile domain-containing protein n=1 Tax=Gossypium stocksii TaxID=47602 RepID=A0A9D3ZU41_9ROSI|nr:hypothetical protein J1N35_029796 [Gossypium stocksii]
MHTFHLLCGECTITLEDVQLQLGLPVDGYVVIGSTQSTDWGAACYELLGAILDNINGGWIEMDWLRDTFPEPDNDSTELERIRYARAYILEIIGGYLMPDLSQNPVHLIWLLKLVDFRAVVEFSWGSTVLATLYRKMYGATRLNKAKIGGCLSLLQSWAWFCFPFLCSRVDHPRTVPLITRWNHSASYVGMPTSLEDIRLLLDQRWEAQEPIIIPELACMPEYMPWFRIHRRPYLPSEDERRRQICIQKERRGPLNPRKRDDNAGLSTVPTQSPSPSTAPTITMPINSAHTVTGPSTSTDDTHITVFLDYASPMVGWNAWPSSSPFPITPSGPPIYRPPSHEESHEAPSRSSSFYQSPSPFGIQTPPP